MKNLIVVMMVLLGVSVNVSAAQGTFKIINVGVINDPGAPHIRVAFDRALPEAPECAANYPTNASFRADSEIGKLWFTLALAAHAQEKPVYIIYSSTTCGLWGNRGLITRMDIKS